MGLVACAADPSAKRTRRVMSEQEELDLGKEAAEQVEQYIGFAGSEELKAYVSRIGQRLVKHSSRSTIVHEFHVVDMKEPNAFALPGGYIYVSRGLLAIMNSEDELAAVIGHEIGHVAGRHSAQRQAKSRGWIPLQILAGIGGAAASVVSPGLGSAVAGAGQLPASLAIASYSRKQEEEADRLGQQYAAAEGWDPAAISDTMDALTREQELAGAEDPSRMSFFDTHPTTPDRAKKGREYAKALSVAPANRIEVDRNAFLGVLDGLVLGDSARGGAFVDHNFVHPELGFAITFPRGWAAENAPTAVLAQPEGSIRGAGAPGRRRRATTPSAFADQIASEGRALRIGTAPRSMDTRPRPLPHACRDGQPRDLHRARMDSERRPDLSSPRRDDAELAGTSIGRSFQASAGSFRAGVGSGTRRSSREIGCGSSKRHPDRRSARSRSVSGNQWSVDKTARPRMRWSRRLS